MYMCVYVYTCVIYTYVRTYIRTYIQAYAHTSHDDMPYMQRISILPFSS